MNAQETGSLDFLDLHCGLQNAAPAHRLLHAGQRRTQPLSLADQTGTPVAGGHQRLRFFIAAIGSAIEVFASLMSRSWITRAASSAPDRLLQDVALIVTDLPWQNSAQWIQRRHLGADALTCCGAGNLQAAKAPFDEARQTGAELRH